MVALDLVVSCEVKVAMAKSWERAIHRILDRIGRSLKAHAKCYKVQERVPAISCKHPRKNFAPDTGNATANKNQKKSAKNCWQFLVVLFRMCL